MYMNGFSRSSFRRLASTAAPPRFSRHAAIHHPAAQPTTALSLKALRQKREIAVAPRNFSRVCGTPVGSSQFVVPVEALCSSGHAAEHAIASLQQRRFCRARSETCQRADCNRRVRHFFPSNSWCYHVETEAAAQKSRGAAGRASQSAGGMHLPRAMP